MKHAPHILALVAALQGAAGAALAAVAAHLEGGAALSTASQFLMVHAPAGLALATLAGGALRSGALVVAGFALQAGVTLFACDVALRALGHGRLFPYAAPIGGSTTILAWLAIAAIAGAQLLRKSNSSAEK